MQAYKTMATMQKRHRLILENIPFRAGQQVEVVVLTKPSTTNHMTQIKALFAETQALPQIQSITEEDIANEIMAYRANQLSVR